MIELPTRSILVVEDDDALRELAVIQLESFGYRVLAASDVETGSQLLRSDLHIDMIFLDVHLTGGRSGKEVLDVLATRSQVPKYLLTSGYPREYVAAQGNWGERFQFLQKPYSRDALSGAVALALEDELAENT